MKMNQLIRFAAFTLCVSLPSACSFHARDADEYKRVTRELVDARGSAIKQCYDVELATNEASGGRVVVSFTVEKASGRIVNVQQADGGTAPRQLSDCVVTAIDGLQLDPPDRRDGLATFVWEFKGNPTTAPAEAGVEAAPTG
ncbi:MAG: AgmX/PglI C-terminal domain-containing protein [Nannocystaceae bacterium]